MNPGFPGFQTCQIAWRDDEVKENSIFTIEIHIVYQMLL